MNKLLIIKKEVFLMKNNFIAMAAVAVVAGGGGFWGGMKYQQNKTTPTGIAGQFQPPSGMGQRANGQVQPSGLPMRDGSGMQNEIGMQNGAGGPINGEIISLDEGTITIQTQDGGTKIVVYSATTNFNKTTTGSSSDLQLGENVMVIGAEDSAGTVTAQTIAF
jgi:hypothetical protein